MKKFITKLVSLVIAGALAIGTLAGCDLITTNVERDMKQIVAKVAISDEFDEKIYKRQMVSEYNSYGYTYEQYYGYTTSDTYDLILTDLVENRIISQQARLELAKATGTAGAPQKSYFVQASEVAYGDRTSIEHVLAGDLSDGKNAKNNAFTSINISKDTKLEEYLSPYEYEYSRYSVLTGIKSLIDSYDEEDETEVDPYEVYSVTSRATLTQPATETGNEWELKNDDELSKIDEDTLKSIEKIKDTGITFSTEGYTNKYDLTYNFYKAYNDQFENFIKDKEGKSALIKIIRSLKKAGLITEEEAKVAPTTTDGVLALSYFNDALTTTYENQIVSKYKLALQNELEKKIDVNTLYAEYVNLFNTQIADFEGSTESYETALSESGEDTFVVYHPGTAGVKNGYGYVMNLLIGFDEMQTTLLNAYKAKSNVTNGEIEAYRDSLVSTLVAKDQRVSWIYSGYGEYDDVNNKFTFKESYVKNENLREFNGTIKNAKPYEYLDSYGKSKTGYNYGKITATDVTYNNFKTTFEKVMGVALVGENWAVTNIERTLGEKDVDNFRDLIFAYSTDSGSLSETYGYIYSPLTSSTTYVKEFANKAKDLVALGEGAIGAVTTDYGVHVMLCSKVIVGTGKTVMDKATFENKLTNENEIPYQFKEYKLNVVVAGEVNNKATSFINANKSKVEYYEDRYSDLITKE